MVLDSFANTLFMRGLVLTILGVGFWVGGLVFANYLWNHYRGERE